MVNVIWTKKAFGQLERAIKYIREEQGLSYAEIVLNKLVQTTELLEKSPKMGTVEPLLAHKKMNIDF